ncbi:MAG: peptidoglycan DD-metalloendopeptidase family protein [Bacteroidales bacterium]|nr:peptidoglycan DD-metalloendopeptidase family protein [Bacteroidales bacterium]
MIYNAYKHRDTKVWFMYILASENLEQGYRRWNYLKNYSKSITAQAEKIRNLKEEQKRQLAKVQQLKNNNMKVQAARTQEYNTLTREEKQSQAFARSLDKKQKQYRQQLAQKRRESERLSKEVEKMIAAEIKRQQEIARRQEELAKKAKEEKQKQNVPAQENKIAQLELQEYSQTKKLSGNFAVNRGKLPFPVQQGVIIERFGEHPHPTLKNVKLPFNNGINISTKPGSSVKVVFDGVVKQVIAIPGYNQCVLVQHGQYFTFYCKLAKVGVKVSDKLSTGDIIGTLEENGSTAVLHFELWNGTTKQNPELWLEK